MATKTKKGKQREPLRRRTWGIRVTVWAALTVALAGVFVYLIISAPGGGRDGGAPSSRFDQIHTFDTEDYHSLALSPVEDSVVLFGHHGGVQMSRDNGSGWETLLDESGRDAMNLVFDPFSPRTIYMAGHDVYYRSDDAGGTWASVRSDLPGLDLHAFAASAAREGRLYAFAVGSGLYRSDDRGSGWKLVAADAPPGTNSIVELPDGTLLLGATDQGILRSEDGGKTWAPSRAGIDIGAIFAIKGDPKGERLYAGTDHGVYVSTDGGRNWSKTALDDTWILVVGVDPQDSNHVLAINRNGELYRSIDGGLNWG